MTVQTPAKVQTVNERPPSVLLAKCEKPEPLPLLTTRDLLQSRRDYKIAFDRCAAKTDRLRQWYIDMDTRKSVANTGM